MSAVVLADNVWVDGVLLARGTPRNEIETDLVDRVGSHLWTDAVAGASIDADGVARTGLKDNVWLDGTLYAKGSTPPLSVAARIGDHLWVGGRRPVPAPDGDDEHDEAPDTSGTVLPTVPEVIPAGYDNGGYLPPGLVTIDDVEPEPPNAPPAPIDRDDDVTPDPQPEVNPHPQVEHEATPPVGPVPPEPKRAGRGATRASWADYAAALGLNTTVEQSRDDIIAAVDAALAAFPATTD